MLEQRSCDFCGRLEEAIPEPSIEEGKLILDADNLWVCYECRSNLKTHPVGKPDSPELDASLLTLVGQSAGAICRTLDLPYQHPYTTVIDAASFIGYDQDLYMSEWLFLSQWLDGSTVWHNPDGTSKAILSLSGDLQILTI